MIKEIIEKINENITVTFEKDKNKLFSNDILNDPKSDKNFYLKKLNKIENILKGNQKYFDKITIIINNINKMNYVPISQKMPPYGYFFFTLDMTIEKDGKKEKFSVPCNYAEKGNDSFLYVWGINKRYKITSFRSFLNFLKNESKI